MTYVIWSVKNLPPSCNLCFLAESTTVKNERTFAISLRHRVFASWKLHFPGVLGTNINSQTDAQTHRHSLTRTLYTHNRGAVIFRMTGASWFAERTDGKKMAKLSTRRLSRTGQISWDWPLHIGKIFQQDLNKKAPTLARQKSLSVRNMLHSRSRIRWEPLQL